MRRVVITGVGMVTAGGVGVERSWTALCESRDVLRPPSQIGGRSFAYPVAEADDFQPSVHFDRKEAAALDRVSQLAIVAAREAVAQAGVEFGSYRPERTRCIIGTGAGGEITRDEASQRVYGGLSDRVHPLTVPKVMVSAVASQVAMTFAIFGGVYVISSACASAAHAIGQAFGDIRSGTADVAVTGGSEACLGFGCLTAWQALHILSDDRCRPFSKGRRGVVLAEGATMLVLEEFEAARARGAEMLGELVGFGMSSDAGSLTSPDVDGMTRSMQWAIADAGWNVDQVEHVNAHGTGTYANDVCEYQALRQTFGERLKTIPVTANKSVLGHSLGASAATELGLSLMTLKHGVVPPTANFAEADPECPVDCVPDAPRAADIDRILSNSFAFGGLNVSLALQRA